MTRVYFIHSDSTSLHVQCPKLFITTEKQKDNLKEPQSAQGSDLRRDSVQGQMRDIKTQTWPPNFNIRDTWICPC